MNSSVQVKETGAKLEWVTKDPAQFPSLTSLSAGLLFFRRVLVYRGPAPRLEFVTVEVPAQQGYDKLHADIFLKFVQWNAQWEAGPYRELDKDDLPKPLSFLRDLGSLDAPTSDIVLIPREGDNIYNSWAPLYHLLPRKTLLRYGLPVIHGGAWPIRGGWRNRIDASQSHALEMAFAGHLWSHGIGRAMSPIAAFSADDSLKLLSHDLSYWRAHMERLLRSTARDLGRVKRNAHDQDPVTIPTKRADLSYEMPTFGTEMWTGEAEAEQTTRDLIDLADEQGNLRALIDAIRSHRVEEDFSERWSGEREDFERKLYCKRNKVKVSFVEFNDSIPYFDGEAELHGDVLYRNLLSVVDRRERRVVVCLHSGVTGVRDIAEKLGYANHSPVSKALARIRAKAKKWLD